MAERAPGEEASTVRSEEQLRVAVHSRGVTRAVLRRVIVVEERTITVQVRHEEARLEILALDESTPLAAAAALQEPPSIVLRREEVLLTTRLVPVERVRLRIDAVTEDLEVTEDVRHERVDVQRTDGEGAPIR